MTTTERSAIKDADSIQEQLACYAHELRYEDISVTAVHAAKARIIDTLGALMGGYFGEPCFIARNLAATMPDPHGATVIGSRMKTVPDMAAFVNATAARYAEANDVYDKPGVRNGHPSDVITPLLAVAEYVRASGRELISAIMVAYEIYLRICDAFHNLGFDHTTFGGIATAAGAGRLLKLPRSQLSHCISMAVVPNNILRQVRAESSMWKVAAAGHSARAGVFAALLARAGMEGPHLPFEGKAGWRDHVAREPLRLAAFGGGDIPFKLEETLIKQRPSSVHTISSIIAAEKVAPLSNADETSRIVVEVYKYAKNAVGTGERRWNPDSREAADHSIPYVVAATLMDGTLTPRSFDDNSLWNPRLRALMQKIEVVENADFTKAHEQVPVEYRTRVTVIKRDGSKEAGECSNDSADQRQRDAQITVKFRGFTEDFLGATRVESLAHLLWNVDHMENVAGIPSAFALE